jgi:hypothetical protein
MQRVGEHPVPVGPLAVRWLAYELQEPRAGAAGRARIRLENAGSAPWRRRGHTMVQLSYHWLDLLGNPIFWDGVRTEFPRRVEPGETAELEAVVVAPRPPGRYRLAFDLVEEHRFWFEEVGSASLDITVEVRPRIAERRLAVVVHGSRDPETDASLAVQEEPVVTEDPAAVAHLAAGARPDPTWSRLLLDAHQEGYAAVGPAIEIEGGLAARRERARFAPWAPGGRNPRFGYPLLMPSLLDELFPGEREGMPSFSGDEALFEGRAVVRLRPRSGRPSG